MTINQLRIKIEHLPKDSGIYIFKSPRNKPLYIGKALNLKNRIKSYLTTNDLRIGKMIETARSLKFVRTESDIEALILESQLIKKHQPAFNIMLRDDKQYFYVGFTEDVFPKLFLTHQPTVPNFKFKILNSKLKSAYADFVGPFTDGNTLKSTLRFLRRIFPYCTCKQLHNNFCLNYHIGKCLGYCCLKNKYLKDKSKNELQKPEITKIINSYNLSVRTSYKNLIYNSLRELKEYRKNITAIRSVLAGKKKSVIKNLEKEMAQLAKRDSLEKAIELREKMKSLKRVFENAKIIQKSSHTHISIYGYDNKIEKKTENNLIKILGLSKMPVRIEGYDVSNMQGAHATGSMVVFTNGKPDKNQYRKFKINLAIHHDRGVLQSNKLPGDTDMLKEILERRFRHEEWLFPDLILIDGGKGQVNAARAAISKFQIPIIGISKNERHLGHQLIIPDRKSASWRTIPLTKLSPADKNLLLAVDSEAHRFAISYYRKLHKKEALFIPK